MKREGGLTVGLLAVLTMLGVSSFPNKSPENPPAAESRKPATESAKMGRTEGPRLTAPCREIANRLRRFAGDAPRSVDLWKLPDSCYEGSRPERLSKVTALPGVRFAIAIVPHPVSTHLPLFFDRLVETIQQAAQDVNYAYDTSWFPWEPADKTYELLGDQQVADDLRELQDAQPGVMVFRRATDGGPAKAYEGGLVVFLVGEQPTGGIGDDQFEQALAWMAELGGPSDGALRILGPTFSGSLPSLWRALKRELGQNPHAWSQIFISSGTVSSSRSYEGFDAWLKSKAKDAYFRTAMESDDLMVDRFCRYLGNQGYDVKHVAFLSEDETAFGGAPVSDGNRDHNRGTASPCEGAIRLYYPRDIATLRSAYEKQAIFTPAKPESEKSGSAPSTTLRGDLSEPSSNDHDTVRSYGGQLTPLAQESVLLDIANRLNEKRSQFIVLRSTSTLDQIFLSQFLRHSYPEGRVVIDGADLLFSRGAEGKSLRGVMLLSTYPLLTGEQDWTASLLSKPSGSYRTFGEDTQEGEYIAARELLRDTAKESHVPFRDYGPPAWAADPANGGHDNERPATWLSVVARRQIWPLAALNSYTLNDSTLSGTLEPLSARGYGLPITDGDSSPLRFPTALWMFFAACLLWNAIHWYFCRRGSIMGSPRARAYFAPLRRWQHPALICTGSAILGMLGVAVAAASGLFSWILFEHPFHHPWTGVCLLLFVLASLAMPFFAGRYNFKLETVGASREHAQAVAMAVAATASAGGVVPWLSGGVRPGPRASAEHAHELAVADAAPPEKTPWWRERTGVAAISCCCVGLFALVQFGLGYHLSSANRIPAFMRSLNLASGVSALLPEILLLAGAYMWFWFTLRGLAHFGDDRPVLPLQAELPQLDERGVKTPLMPMFSAEGAGAHVEKAALPLNGFRLPAALFAGTFVVGLVALEEHSVRTLGELQFGMLISVWVCLYVAVILTDGVRMWQTWDQLRQLLVYLDRLPLRRTLRALKGLAWGSIWKMSGNVLEERYRVISLQMESLRHLKNALIAWDADDSQEVLNRNEVLNRIKSEEKNVSFVTWFVKLKKGEAVTDVTEIRDLQARMASIGALAMVKILRGAWQGEIDSLIFGRAPANGKDDEHSAPDLATDAVKPHVRAAEEFFVLPYLAFIQNTLGRIRTMVLGGACLFTGATLAVSSYPFDPLSVLGAIFLAVFVFIGGVTALVYSQMSRDATLSRITNTRPGELGLEFWVRLVGFGVGPLMALLTTLFPSITDFVFSWLQPGMEALK